MGEGSLFQIPYNFPLQSPPIFAPFLSDLSTVSTGNIYYRLIRDQNLLRSIDSLIMAYDPSADESNPTIEALIVTWQDVPQAFVVSTTVSFQAVLATTGVSSYVFYLYGNSSHPDGATVGINYGDGVSYILEDNRAGIELRGNVYNAVGFFFYRVDGTESDSPATETTTTLPPTAPPPVMCTFVGEFRVAGGTREIFQVYNGVPEYQTTIQHIEVCYNGIYNPICSEYISASDAAVICSDAADYSASSKSLLDNLQLRFS